MSDLYSNPLPDAQLLAGAKAAFKQAYAPFSRFRVGAALRTPDGQVYFGANVENSSFGLTRCAEQSAVQAMATAGGRTFTDLVVYTEASPPASFLLQSAFLHGPDRLAAAVPGHFLGGHLTAGAQPVQRGVHHGAVQPQQRGQVVGAVRLGGFALQESQKR